MLLDLENLFSDAQAVTAAAASTNIVKMASTEHNMTEVAFGQPIPLLIQVNEEFKAAEISALKAAVQTSATTDFTNAVTLVESTVPAAELKVGCKFPIAFIPKGNLGYMRVYYTPTFQSGKTATTTGKITAGIVASHDNSFQDM